MLVASPFDLGFGETALRLALATVVGALLGLDREIRGHAAGLRTHGVVSLSSAVITISALLLFEQLRSAEAQPDPLRVVQGLAQAIGFIAAGLIFVKGGDVRNLTTAANIWLATAIGIACGAGQYGLVVLAAGFGLLLVIGLRAADQWLPEQNAEPGEQDRRRQIANADRRQDLARANGDDNGGEMADDTRMRTGGMGYGRFAAMIATSTIVMFGLMYLNTYAWNHVEYSQTRTWMAVVMGAAMALIMIGFMWGMYRNIRANIGIVAGAIVAFGVALWLVRSQETVDDVSYMKAMIPHHSIAIMTSERAHIKDPEVRKLADSIIDAQVREITEMKRLITRLEARSTPNGVRDLPSHRDKADAPTRTQE